MDRALPIASIPVEMNIFLVAFLVCRDAPFAAGTAFSRRPRAGPGSALISSLSQGRKLLFFGRQQFSQPMFSKRELGAGLLHGCCHGVSRPLRASLPGRKARKWTSITSPRPSGGTKS
jgi:hypothetical protein